MKVAAFYLVILVGVAISMAKEATTEPRCHCATTRKTPLNTKRIATIQRFLPRPHCPREEVIIKLKTGESECLEPTSLFAKKLLKGMNSRPKGRQSIKHAITVLPTTAEHAQVTGSSW